ncbi:glycerophosphodiester phosphodiesterase [Horticoccus sp. 23ND18S-11]|uniref:glycerophosphodiester phosphodiesterase n=1 Tax=Horticoccus sp. 23ND18S-11 TaxID=3391832 RepID=UPI0039C91AD9
MTSRAADAVTMPERGICAHRGASGTHPENTVPALEEAVRLGAQMVEIDLALTRDGEIVLMHDATVHRTTNGKGRVIEFDLAALKQLDAGAWKHPRFAGTRVPTLAEALAVLPRNVWINLDVKADARFGDRPADVVRRVAELVVATGRQHQTFLAARAEVAAIARATFPGIRICSMDRTKDPAEYVRDAVARRVDFIQLRDCAQDARLPAWIAALKTAGVRINYYYTDEPGEAARLLQAGVDFVLVNQVESVRAQVLPR